MDFNGLSALTLASMLRNGSLTAPQLIEHLVQQKDINNCYTSLNTEQALEEASRIQRKIDSGAAVSPLAGIPLAVKDNICVKGMPATCASVMLKNYLPPYHATVIERAQATDMVVFGKLNMDEFAMGSTGETSCFGAVVNPHNRSRSAGGSSSGAAAAVAGGNAFLALGTDTGGSVRQPCACCGTVGLKPTYGAVSRYGLIAYVSSMDTVGPIGKSVADVAALFQIIKGKDVRDSTSIGSADIVAQHIEHYSLQGKKIGLPAECFYEETDTSVKDAVLAAADKLKAAGAVVEMFPMPLAKYGVAAYYIIACAEASANLARYDGVRYGHRASCESIAALFTNTRSEGFGYELKKRILLGNFVLSHGYFDSYYLKAMRVKHMIAEAYTDAFQRYDFLLTPVMPTTAPPLGEAAENSLKMMLSDAYTVTVNLAGLPALALPCGTDKSGMPVGLQLIGRPFDEAAILGAGRALEKIGLTESYDV